MDLNEAKNTIRNLLNLSENDAAAALEINNALHHARRLMLRHNLTEDDCRLEEPKSAAEIAADEEYGETCTYSVGANLSRWETALYHAIADLVGTVSWYRETRVDRRTPHGTLDFGTDGRPKKASRITYYGPAADCIAAADLAATWAVTISGLSRMKYGGTFRGPGRSYAEGFAYELRSKVRKTLAIEREAAKGLPPSHEASEELSKLLDSLYPEDEQTTALALHRSHEIMRAKKTKAEDWLKNEKGIKLVSSGGGGGRGAHDPEAWGAGRDDGRRADFSRKGRKALGG